MFNIANLSSIKILTGCIADIYFRLKTVTCKLRQRRHTYIANFKHISHLFLVFLLLNLNKCMLAEIAFIKKPLLNREYPNSLNYETEIVNKKNGM